MNRHRHRHRWAAALVVIVLLLAGCGGSSDDGPLIESDRAGGDSDNGSGADELELASASEFCLAAVNLIGSMETVGVADIERPAQLRLVYERTAAGLAEVAELAPNTGIANQIGDVTDLFEPLVNLLRSADWDLTAVDPDEAAELAVLSESGAPELDSMTDFLEGYVSAECGVDIEEARATAVDDFFYQFVDAPPEPEVAGDGTSTGDGSLLTLDDVPIGTRGGNVFCEADQVWNNVMALTADSNESGFLDPFLQGADVYTKWGERMPVEIAVRTVEMNVGYAEVVATFGSTQDITATRTEFLDWRGGSSYRAGREAVDSWVDENCS